METLGKIHEWKQTRTGHLVMGLLEGGAAYFFASKAIDTGSWWQYLLTAIFAVGMIQNFVGVIRTRGHGKE